MRMVDWRWGSAPEGFYIRVSVCVSMWRWYTHRGEFVLQRDPYLAVARRANKVLCEPARIIPAVRALEAVQQAIKDREGHCWGTRGGEGVFRRS